MVYNLNGNLEGILCFIQWKCSRCEEQFLSVILNYIEPNKFIEGGKKVMTRSKHIVVLCNSCIRK